MGHQWLEGNLPVSSHCTVCEKKCGSVRKLVDARCLWCKATVSHNVNAQSRQGANIQGFKFSKLAKNFWFHRLKYWQNLVFWKKTVVGNHLEFCKKPDDQWNFNSETVKFSTTKIFILWAKTHLYCLCCITVKGQIDFHYMSRCLWGIFCKVLV